ncbi:MAG: hypothetical protein ABW185_08665 [Sedimenticola sp.]
MSIASANIDAEFPVERAHRLGNNKRRDGKPRGVIVKFTQWKHKELVLKKGRELLRDKTIKVTEDFSASVREARRMLLPTLVRLRNENPDKKVYMRYDKVVMGNETYTWTDGNVERK